MSLLIKAFIWEGSLKDLHTHLIETSKVLTAESLNPEDVFVLVAPWGLKLLVIPRFSWIDGYYPKTFNYLQNNKRILEYSWYSAKPATMPARMWSNRKKFYNAFLEGKRFITYEEAGFSFNLNCGAIK